MLYAFLAMVFISVVHRPQWTSNKPDDSWLRIVAMIYLIVMQVYFVVLQFLSRRAEQESASIQTRPVSSPRRWTRESGRNG